MILLTLVIFLVFVVAGLTFFYCPKRGILVNVMLGTYVSLYLFPLYLLDSGDSALVMVRYSIFIGAFGLISGVLLFSKAFSKINKSSVTTTFLVGNGATLLALVFIALGLFAIYQSLLSSGGLLSVILGRGGREYLEARIYSKGAGTLGAMAWLGPVALSVLWARFLSENRGRVIIGGIFLLALLLILTGYFLLTVRHNAVATLLALFVVSAYLKDIALKSFVIMFSGALAIVVVFQAVRVAGIDQVDSGSYIETTMRSFEHLDVTRHIISRTEDLDYSYFAHMSDLPIFLIPRALWDEKPSTSTLNRQFFPEVASIGSEKAVGIVGEGYASMGFFGVFLICFAFSSFICYVQLLLERSTKKTLLRCLAISLIAPYAYIGVRTGVFGKHQITFIIMFIQAYIIVKLSAIRLRTP